MLELTMFDLRPKLGLLRLTKDLLRRKMGLSSLPSCLGWAFLFKPEIILRKPGMGPVSAGMAPSGLGWALSGLSWAL